VAKDSFVAFVLDQLSGLEGLGCRAMFGGHGLYCGPTFFGMVFDGRAYFKTDDATAPDYARRGMKPFRPNDQQVLRTYYEVPADVLESREEVLRWARTAARAAAGGTARETQRRARPAPSHHPR
jgi:DNA transformation protein